METYKMTPEEHAYCYSRSPRQEHDYFEDAINVAISEEIRWEVNDLYNEILSTYDNHDEDICLYALPELLTAFLKKPTDMLLELRRAYNKRVWQLVIEEAGNRSVNKEITDYDAKYIAGMACDLMTNADVTAEKFNNILDTYNIKASSMRWIVGKLCDKNANL